MLAKRFSRLALGVALAAGLAVPAGAVTERTVPDGGQLTLGQHGWQVSSSADAGTAGTAISTPGFDTAKWLKVHNDDAGAPGTEINALLQNGACPNVYYSDNMRRCFGEMTKRGPVTVPRFAVPWWYRADFFNGRSSGSRAAGELVLNGIMGSADVWVNGQQVADHNTITGAFAQRTVDVRNVVHQGQNTLAILMYPNNPEKDLTLSNLDWTQIPPDNDTGIRSPVVLRMPGTVELSDTQVRQQTAADLGSSALTVSGQLDNTGTTPISVRARATITPPAGKPLQVSKSVRISAHSSKTVSFTPQEFPELRIAHPQIWWPYNMGGQPLYRAKLSADNLVSKEWQFGIRTVSSRLIGASAAAPDGVRQYSVNGKPIVIRGGGYSDDILQRYSTADVAQQVRLIRGLGLNAIRLEGHDQPDDFYQRMDQAGILVLGGFACCDSWEPASDGSGVSESDYQTMYLSARTLGTQLRSHPSVITYQWSDNSPIPRQETETLRGFADAHFDVPIVASAEYKKTAKLGPAGEKEGPYGWVPPEYFYDSSHFDPADSSRTNAGGAWGFDSEESAGDTVPTLDSLRRFLSPEEQRKLWQEPDYNQYHLNYEKGHDKYQFGELYSFDTAMDNRYGKTTSLESYVNQAQLANYESVRSQFEAFIAHANNKPTPSTGLIYWQLNKGWPSMLWTLYNNDGDQAGSYFGAQQANRPVHAIYTYDDNSVALANLSGTQRNGLSVRSRVYDISGKLLDEQTANAVNAASQQVRDHVLTPKVPAQTKPGQQASTYFVELQVTQHGKVLDQNTYWRSTQPDVVDWPAAYGNPQPKPAQYADLSQLRKLAPAKVNVQAKRTGPGTATVTISNPADTGAPAFFTRADLRSDNKQVTSAVWENNDVTLWPGETQTLTVRYNPAQRGTAITFGGYNVAAGSVPLP